MPKKYLTFGDSASDFAMAKQLHDEGMEVEHVHVGDPKDIPQEAGYKITTTSGKFNAGTREFFAREK
jgi:hypothetical protein